MSLLTKGVSTLSQLLIDADKDWAGHLIKNLGAPVDDADALRRADALLKFATFTTKPPAGPEYEGEIIRVRSGAGAKTYIYTCVQNSANGWEWVQLGVTT